MILFLDNAESILDPQGTDAREIYTAVEELCDFDNICLGITSRISTVPPNCERPTIHTLSMESACKIFYNIYKNHEQSETISDLVRQLDFHALSITLLATTASYNIWDYDRLVEEWNTQRAQVLRTDHNRSLAATIELSLTSPTFRKLGPGSRELLGVVAFFPQGIDKNNLGWLFPDIPDIKSTIDRFCALSLTYRNNNFTTMLAPIRDYLAPANSKPSPLLCATRDRYFARLSVDVYPDKPGFQEARWIMSEDVNVEHLLDAFASVDMNTDDAWGACGRFLEHLCWHKPRKTILVQKIEALPDGHHAKPKCLFGLAQLLQRLGNRAERNRLLVQTLGLERERANDSRIALTLTELSDASRRLGHFREGIQQAEDALGIYEQLGDKIGQADSLISLTFALLENEQLDAAENVALRTINLIPEGGQEFILCQCHRYLGHIYQSKGETEKAVHNFKTAISIASVFDWHFQLFWVYLALGRLFRGERRFDEANNSIAQAKLHAVDNAYHLGCAMGSQARVWHLQCRLEDAKLEALDALEILENLGATQDAKSIRDLLRSLGAQIQDTR